ncbi:hypothetical protein [Bacillus sp. V5-8f]|uniref:hypothetical protein n=1 Tax=Bacillus sp. V5-8f TaxID=2053044 RepID=UPI000C777F75|nr:hypothetical protein [Bacillus sp. V5-8f]PLT34102.1 hypothetical protein CUU64_07645 [Bacillus sp. V5-8f]
MPYYIGLNVITDEEIEIAKSHGITYRTLYKRLMTYEKKWTKEKAINTPPLRPKEKRGARGTYSVGVFSKLTPEQIQEALDNGVKLETLRWRMKNGYTFQEAKQPGRVRRKSQLGVVKVKSSKEESTFTKTVIPTELYKWAFEKSVLGEERNFDIRGLYNPNFKKARENRGMIRN